MQKLFIKTPTGRYAPATKNAVCEAAAEYLKPLDGEVIRSPADTEDFLRGKLAHLEHEVFVMVLLNNRHKVLAYSELFRGTIDGTSVYPREVIKEILKHNAAAIILAHNHPSGTAEPSQADERITKRIKAACDLIDVRLLDHLIIAGQQSVSFAKRGLL